MGTWPEIKDVHSFRLPGCMGLPPSGRFRWKLLFHNVLILNLIVDTLFYIILICQNYYLNPSLKSFFLSYFRSFNIEAFTLIPKLQLFLNPSGVQLKTHFPAMEVAIEVNRGIWHLFWCEVVAGTKSYFPLWRKAQIASKPNGHYPVSIILPAVKFNKTWVVTKHQVITNI